MTSPRTHATNLILAVATVAAIGAALVMPGHASASIDEPWPEPPSCSNDTGTCSSMEDIVAYECYFENPDSPFNFCDDPFAELQSGRGSTLVAPQPDPDPAPTTRR